jgi:hypothetical protein
VIELKRLIRQLPIREQIEQHPFHHRSSNGGVRGYDLSPTAGVAVNPAG